MVLVFDEAIHWKAQHMMGKLRVYGETYLYGGFPHLHVLLWYNWEGFLEMQVFR